MKILTAEQDALLLRERNFLNDLRVRMANFNASKEDLDTLGQSIRQLDDLFLLVIVGEFNSGKSAFINALLGQKLLKEGVTPTTSQINILRFGEKTEKKILESLAVARDLARAVPLGEARPLAEELRERLARVPGVARAEIAGEIRRSFAL